MKKKLISTATVIIVASLLMTSCIGSFPLFNKVLTWNRSLDNNKFVNELVFLALCIVPVYPIASTVDILVLNSIEFWTGETPLAKTENVKKVETEDGIYAIKMSSEGYKIQKEGSDEVIDFVFNQAEKTWNLSVNGKHVQQLLKFIDENHVAMVNTSNQSVIIELNENGVLSYSNMIQPKLLALKQ